MTKLLIKNYEKNTEQKTSTQFTILQFIKINFLGWGFYDIEKVNNNKYFIINKFDGVIEYEITKTK